MKKSMLALCIAGAIAAPIMSGTTAIKRHSKKFKSCLNCGKSHDHNNSFCSVECCKDFNRD